MKTTRTLLALAGMTLAGLGQAAGLPDGRMPVVTVLEESTRVTYNDPALTKRLAGAMTAWLGTDRVKPHPPTMGGEDFSQYGLTLDKVPICIWSVGAAAPEKLAESQRTGVPVPSNHNSGFAPVPEPTIKAAVTSMTVAVLELLAKR